LFLSNWSRIMWCWSWLRPVGIHCVGRVESSRVKSEICCCYFQ
jgi:hypothetical protein